MRGAVAPPSVPGYTPMASKYHHICSFAGTHELQRIEVHHSQNRVIITSEVLNGSHTSGMFIVAYSITEDFDLHYSINSRQDNQQRLEAEIQGLSGNAYNISVFSLENGVPFARAAALPKSVDLSNSKGNCAPQYVM